MMEFFMYPEINRMVTTVQIHFSEVEVRRLTRREFRQLVSERLQVLGDELMAAWEKVHGAEGRG